MKSNTNEGPVTACNKYLCGGGVCRKGVGVNSIYCSFCSHKVHKQCSGLKGWLSDKPDSKVGFQKKCFISFNESPLKMMEITFYFTLKPIFILKIFKF